MKKKFLLVLATLFVVSLALFLVVDPQVEEPPFSFVLLCGHEFPVRADGLPGLQAHYGFEFTAFRSMEDGAIYGALADGMAEAGIGFATDGRIVSFDLVGLVDDKQFFPVYNPAPVVRKDTLARHPEIKAVLNKLGPALDTATMTAMNYSVDIGGKSPVEVALSWLQEQGFVADMPAQGTKGPLTVGSKEFTEQLILGQIAIIALRDADFEVEDQTGLGGTLINRRALEMGDLDLYWEYTGTAWLTFLGQDVPITDAQEAFTRVKEKDLGNDMVWLNKAAFDNTFVVMMQREVAAELGIVTLSDMVAHINEHL